MTSNLPESIGKFQILQPIGEGGMGRLYLARDPDIKRYVAIKLLREGLDNLELRERFNREAKSASALRHSNIVTIFDTGMHQGMPFIVMEYIPGETLAGLIRKRDPVPLGQKLQLLLELCDGMQYAHRKRVVHRDIKPANLMIDEEGLLRILDFGIARLGASAGLTAFGAVMGTPNYMAPEQWEGQNVDGRADIFAAGAVMYELFSYEKAFGGPDVAAVMKAIVMGEPRSLTRLCPDLDRDLVDIVTRCIAKAPDDRFQTFGAVQKALAAVRERMTSDSEGLPTNVSGADWGDLLKVRADQIRKHLDAARQAFESGKYTAALRASQQALIIDPEQADAKSIADRSKAAIEQERQLQQWLSSARTELDRGALTAASQLVDQALSVDPDFAAALTVRQSVDEARRRRAEERERECQLTQALDAAREALAKEAFDSAIGHLDRVLQVEPSNTEAISLRGLAESAQAATARAEAEAAAARDVLDQARRRFARGDHASAFELLAAFEPQHLVVEALAELRDELKEIERRRAVVRAAQSALEEAQQRFDRGEHAAAIDLLARFQPRELVADGLAALRSKHADIERLREIERLQEAERLERQTQARAAEARRREEEAARQREAQRQAEAERAQDEARRSEAARRAEAGRRAEVERRAQEAKRQSGSDETIVLPQPVPQPAPVPVPRPEPRPEPTPQPRPIALTVGIPLAAAAAGFALWLWLRPDPPAPTLPVTPPSSASAADVPKVEAPPPPPPPPKNDPALNVQPKTEAPRPEPPAPVKTQPQTPPAQLARGAGAGEPASVPAGTAEGSARANTASAAKTEPAKAVTSPPADPPVTTNLPAASNPPPGPPANVSTAPQTVQAGRSEARETLSVTPLAQAQADIRAALGRYQAGYEGLNPTAIKAVFPSINANALATVFRDYDSLKKTVEVRGQIQIDPDGQRATVSAVVTTVPVVKRGRATTDTSTVTFTLRKTGASWIIEALR